MRLEGWYEGWGEVDREGDEEEKRKRKAHRKKSAIMKKEPNAHIRLVATMFGFVRGVSVTCCQLSVGGQG